MDSFASLSTRVLLCHEAVRRCYDAGPQVLPGMPLDAAKVCYRCYKVQFVVKGSVREVENFQISTINLTKGSYDINLGRDYT